MISRPVYEDFFLLFQYKEVQGIAARTIYATNSKAFYEKYRQYMQKVCENHPRLARQLKTAIFPLDF